MNMSPYGSNAYYLLKKWSHLLTDYSSICPVFIQVFVQFLLK